MSRKLAVSFLLLSLFAAAARAQTDWCNMKSCTEKRSHTLCKYPSSTPASACSATSALGGGLSAADKQNIVNLHNEMRQTVASGGEKRGWRGPQPSAKTGRMPDLQWDDTLAGIAQRWADQCNFKHDKCRDVPADRVGQNIAEMSGTTANANTNDTLDMVRMWYGEVEYFDGDQVKNFSGSPREANGKDVGHYTQIVNGKTTKIGCGLRNYSKNGFYRRYLVCNYEPSGNFPNQPIYET